MIRLLGDRLVARFGRRNVVRFGAICAAIGYTTVTLVSGCRRCSSAGRWSVSASA
ncbi:MAG TPA: hypothetical protein VIU11_17450 [Nakamurella sp.]